MGWFPLRCDAEGFEFTEIPAGRYRLMESHGEHIGYLGEEFALAPGEQLDLGTVLVRPGHALRVRLERASGLEDVAVSGTLRRRDTFRSVGLAFTDGVCTLTDLTPGTYVVHLDGSASHAEVQRELELVADAEVVCRWRRRARNEPRGEPRRLRRNPSCTRVQSECRGKPPIV